MRRWLGLPVEYAGNLLGELIRGKWFGQEMLHVKSGVKVLGVFLIDVRRRENDMPFVVAASKIQDQLPAIDLGHSPISDYEIKAPTRARVHLERFTAVLGGEHDAAGVLQHLGRKLAGEFSNNPMCLRKRSLEIVRFPRQDSVCSVSNLPTLPDLYEKKTSQHDLSAGHVGSTVARISTFQTANRLLIHEPTNL